MKALLHFSASERLRNRISTIADPEIVIVDDTDDDALLREMADTEVLLHVLKPVTAAMIEAAPKLRLIQKVGVGVNAIDLETARRRGVKVANMPGTNTQAVAEHTLALMLAVLRRLAILDAATRRGNGWSLTPETREGLGELRGAKVGFIGYGAIPQRLTRVLTALGAEVRFWNRSPKPDSTVRQVSFNELIEGSDILSLHIPFVPETRHMLNRETFARMKHGAIIINTARGELIDQTELGCALMSGQLGGAGLDVFEEEPALDIGCLANCPNVVTTPHIGWLTPQTVERSLEVILENCRRLGSGKKVRFQIQ